MFNFSWRGGLGDDTPQVGLKPWDSAGCLYVGHMLYQPSYWGAGERHFKQSRNILVDWFHAPKHKLLIFITELTSYFGMNSF